MWSLSNWILLLFFPVAIDAGGKNVKSKADSPHPFYISVTEINHNAKDQTLEISCKMFADDFEQILGKNYGVQLDISSVKDKNTLDRLIPDYVNKHLGIAVDGKSAALHYVGYEKDKESVYCYLQCDHIAAPKKLDVMISILQDFNNTEINIIHVTVNGKRQSTKLDCPEKEAVFKFE